MLALLIPASHQTSACMHAPLRCMLVEPGLWHGRLPLVPLIFAFYGRANEIDGIWVPALMDALLLLPGYPVLPAVSESCIIPATKC